MKTSQVQKSKQSSYSPAKVINIVAILTGLVTIFLLYVSPIFDKPHEDAKIGELQVIGLLLEIFVIPIVVVAALIVNIVVIIKKKAK